MRSIVAQGLFGLFLVAGTTGCTPSLEGQCEKYCQYLFLTCNAGPITQTEAECISTCAEPSPAVNGGACANPSLFFSCVLADQCSQLQGPAGADALEGCALEASCTSPTTAGNNGGNNNGGNNNGGNNGANNNGGSTGGNNGGNNNGGSTGGNNGANNNGGSSGGNNGVNNNGGSSGGNNNGANNNGGNSSNGGFVSSSSSSGGLISGSSSGGITTNGGSSGGTVPFVGMACSVPATGEADPCAADNAGLACNADPTTGATTCTLPEEFEACQPSPGCATDEIPGMTCLNNSAAFTTPTCVNTCTTTANCPDELTSCVSAGGSNFCYYDFCGPSSVVSDGGFLNGAGNYAPCDSASTNDGFCLPFDDGSSTLSICQAGGTLTSGASNCAILRSATAGLSTICASGLTCVEAPDDATFCTKICGGTTLAADGGPGCPSVNGTLDDCNGGTSAPSGLCLEDCTSSTSVCPTGQSCNTSYDVCLP